MRAGAVQAAARLCESVATAREPNAASPRLRARHPRAHPRRRRSTRHVRPPQTAPRARRHRLARVRRARGRPRARGVGVPRSPPRPHGARECKGAFVKASAEVPIVAVIRDRVDAAALSHACDAARALTTGDDPRDPASGAFAHSRVGQSRRGVRVDGRAGSASRRGKSRAPRRRRRHAQTHRGERRHL